MKYMGSKNRIAKYILPIILKDRKPNQTYVELFAGGMNMIDKVDGNRIANDINYYLIQMWDSLINDDWIPNKHVSEEMYQHIKSNKDQYEPWLVGYVGFNSYGAKWFGGYRRDNIGRRDYWVEHYNNIMKQVQNMKNVIVLNKNYWEVEIPPNSIVYLDPPYEGTTKYPPDFNHIKFWGYVREISKQHKVFVSEYNAPNDFECVWSKEINSSLTKETGSKTGIEKLFKYINKEN